MKVSVELEFDFKDMQLNINGLIGNARLHFCEIYTSLELKEHADPDVIVDYICKQLQQIGMSGFIAKKDDIPFEVIIDWQKSLVDVQSIEGQKQADLVFYVERCLEVCSSFAMQELEASEDGFHTMDKRWTEC